MFSVWYNSEGYIVTYYVNLKEATRQNRDKFCKFGRYSTVLASAHNDRFSESYFLYHLTTPHELEVSFASAPLAVHAADAVWEEGLFLGEMKDDRELHITQFCLRKGSLQKGRKEERKEGPREGGTDRQR